MKAVILAVSVALSGCWTVISKDYMAQCKKTCEPNKVDRVSEYVCECQGDNEQSRSDSEQSEHHGGYNRGWY